MTSSRRTATMEQQQQQQQQLQHITSKDSYGVIFRGAQDINNFDQNIVMSNEIATTVKNNWKIIFSFFTHRGRAQAFLFQTKQKLEMKNRECCTNIEKIFHCSRLWKNISNNKSTPSKRTFIILVTSSLIVTCFFLAFLGHKQQQQSSSSAFDFLSIVVLVSGQFSRMWRYKNTSFSFCAFLKHFFVTTFTASQCCLFCVL